MRRERSLPAGWYPTTADAVRSQCARWDDELPLEPREFLAAVVPHAGWAFSGRIAYRTLRRLLPEADTVVVAGGHLRAGDDVRIAPEEAYETPLGSLKADVGLAEFLSDSHSVARDTVPDNTVEVQLPLVHYLYPGASALYLRCPPDEHANAVARSVAEYARRTGRRVVVIGSTDLTHYGPAYGFTPVGSGREAVRWVREENDRAIVEAMLAMEAGETMRLGREERAACSAGGAVCAMVYASGQGATAGRLVEYGQSYDVRPDSSFVGYAGIGYPS